MLSGHSVVFQERSALLIGRDDVLLGAEAEFLAKDTWNGDDESSQEEGGHDGKGEDPLECNGLGEELANAESCREVAESESHRVVLCR